MFALPSSSSLFRRHLRRLAAAPLSLTATLRGGSVVQQPHQPVPVRRCRRRLHCPLNRGGQTALPASTSLSLSGLSFSSSSSPSDMDFEAVKKTVGDRSFTLIDMRTPKEVEELGRIPGGRNLPFKEIHSALSLEEEEFRSKYHFAKPGRADAIVAYCQIGGRSKKGAEALKVAGYTNVRVYPGSFSDWVEKGGEIDRSKDKKNIE